MTTSRLTKISGWGGFVGKNLVDYLRDSPLDLSRISRNELEDGKFDLRNCQSIIHLAGKAHDLRKASNPSEYYQVNFELTKKLYDAFLNSPAEKFIFISSVKAASDHLSTVLHEDIIPRPLTDYGKSKLLAEQYIESRSLPENKSYYILRPCMIHGPGNKGNLNLLYEFVRRRFPYPLAAYHNKRSLLSVDNFCFIIREIILANKIPSGIYNAADSEPLSTNEIVKILAQALGVGPRLLNIPKNIVQSAAKFADILNFPIGTEHLNKLTEDFVVSNEKLQSILPKPLPLSSVAGLLKTAHSFSS